MGYVGTENYYDGRQQELISFIQWQLKNFDSNFLQNINETKLRDKADRSACLLKEIILILQIYSAGTETSNLVKNGKIT